ncbi:MAG TPA: CRTAC1 family protein [Myxococcales bacterium]|nr:CRTAC1 family protein [Myxococcales bacterium]HIN85078.1 CRTAC1 family protein [Myxococcales bacterium]
MNLRLLPVLFVCLCAFGCASGEDSTASDPPRVGTDPGTNNLPIPEDAALLFRDISEWAGINIAVPGGGISFMDVDRDGFDDVIIPMDESTMIFRNRGDGSFYPFFQLEHVGAEGFNAYSLDVNQDGIDDILALYSHGAGIWFGREDGSFYDADLIPEELLDISFSIATFGDVNRDGRHDIYLGRMVTEGHGFEPDDEESVCLDASELEGVTAMGDPAVDIFLNSSMDSYVDGTTKSRLEKPRYTQATMIVDIDEDGWLDLFVGTEGFKVDAVYFGRSNGEFEEKGEALGMEYLTSAMGYDAVDLNEDGLLDIYVTDEVSPEGDKLYIQQPSGHFKFATKQHGLQQTTLGTGWGLGFHDFDNDSDMDLFVANGLPMAANCPGGDQENFYFENKGSAQFEYIPPPKWSGLEVLKNSRAAVFSDIDHDGDLDVLISNTASSPTLLRNDSNSSGRWLQIRLHDPLLSPPVGAKLTLKSGERTLRRDVKGTPSYGGSSGHAIHFGLGESDEARELTVTWPDGQVQVVGDVDADQFIDVYKAL